MSGILRAVSEHGTLLEEMLARSEGGRDVLDDLERASRPSETEAARKVGDENVQMYQEREGNIKRGSGKLPAILWDRPAQTTRQLGSDAGSRVRMPAPSVEHRSEGRALHSSAVKSMQ